MPLTNIFDEAAIGPREQQVGQQLVQLLDRGVGFTEPQQLGGADLDSLIEELASTDARQDDPNLWNNAGWLKAMPLSLLRRAKQG